MIIDEAIEIKEKYQYLLQDASIPEVLEADRLSIEALKAWRNGRVNRNPFTYHLLPGETKD